MRQPPVYAPATSPPPAPGMEPLSGLGRARLILWSSFWILLVGIAIGLNWDRDWHATHRFETFYSPPHVFTYSVVALAGILVAVLVFSPRLRPLFGPGFRFVLFPFAVPGALFLAGGAFVTLGLAGILDDIWHSTFGLDETGWSTPHAMIGWGLLLAFLGFVACRLALRPHSPLPWYTTLFLAYLALSFTATPFMGPMGANRTPQTVRLISDFPVLLSQASAQHTFRIYTQWNITRTNPLFVPLSALWAGAALALVRGIARRRGWMVLLVTFLSFVLELLSQRGDIRRLDTALHASLLHDPAAWMPLPLFPAALVLVALLALRVPERWAHAAAGLVFGILVFLVWGRTAPAAALLVLASLTAVLGAVIGGGIYTILERPSRAGVWRLLFAGVGVPFAVGLIDLYLRLHTPWG